MRYFAAACFLGLGLGVALGLLLVTLDEAWEAFDSHELPAFLRPVATGVRAIRSHVLDLVDTFAAARPDEDPRPPSRLSHEHGRAASCAAC